MDYGGSLDYQVDRHHAHVARLGPVRRAPAARRTSARSRRRRRSSRPCSRAQRRKQTADISKRIYEKYGFSDQRAASAGHFVGMSVHDVGDYTRAVPAGHGHRRRADHRDPGQAPARPDRRHGAGHRRRAVILSAAVPEGSRRGARAHEERRHEWRRTGVDAPLLRAEIVRAGPSPCPLPPEEAQHLLRVLRLVDGRIDSRVRRARARARGPCRSADEIRRHRPRRRAGARRRGITSRA